MKNLKLYLLPSLLAFFLAFGISFSINAAEDDEAEVVPSNPQELLEVVRQGQFADTRAQRQREAKFRNEKNKQSKLLADAKTERARLEREAARLEQRFEASNLCSSLAASLSSRALSVLASAKSFDCLFFSFLNFASL